MDHLEWTKVSLWCGGVGACLPSCALCQDIGVLAANETNAGLQENAILSIAGDPALLNNPLTVRQSVLGFQQSSGRKLHSEAVKVTNPDTMHLFFACFK